jgi:membrane-bound ClpP family serine protease
MTSIVITCIIVAFVFFFLEIFAPGGILAVLGGVSLIAASVLAYEDLGIIGSTAILLGGSVLGFGMFFVEVKLLAKSPYGKEFLHSDRQMAKTPSVGRPDLVGKTGVSLTKMAPSGKVKIDNEIFEAASSSGLIEQGATVEVIRAEHLKLVVKEL